MNGIMRRQKLVKLTLTSDEARILRKIMVLFRNKVAGEGGPTEDIDQLIIKLYRW